MISMRIKNVNPKGWYDIPGYDGIYQINYWADIHKELITAIWHTNMSIQDTKKIDALACERAMVEESR